MKNDARFYVDKFEEYMLHSTAIIVQSHVAKFIVNSFLFIKKIVHC